MLTHPWFVAVTEWLHDQTNRFQAERVKSTVLKTVGKRKRVVEDVHNGPEPTCVLLNHRTGLHLQHPIIRDSSIIASPEPFDLPTTVIRFSLRAAEEWIRVNSAIEQSEQSETQSTEISSDHPGRSRARRSFVLPSDRRDNPSGTLFHRYSIRADTVEQVPSIPMKSASSSGWPSSTPEQDNWRPSRTFVSHTVPSGEHSS